MKAKLLLTMLTAVCLCWIAPLIHAQQSPKAASPVVTGSIAGVVTDPTGAAVPGAKVEVKSLASGAKKSAVTNSAGRFVFEGLPAGRYEATVIVSGFQVVIVREIVVVAGKETIVNVKLHFGR